ncbi:hypothetical protein HYC85_027700 [Camellia sinensis]|uniref:Leucine-rich repeat-containing N-terminal plant-type domain-containing protein n=1 Tax=Camellia sinensis TaxID=4442 RepID=A0A7J7FTB2_CAMSI|nr:hypothetical protein HYC85_027700 [Camellia sinensis]
MALQLIRLCKLKKLEALDISHNHFEGILPSCQSNLTSLKFFDISLNQFTGNISPSLFGSLNSLEYIGLSHNRFEDLPFPLAFLALPVAFIPPPLPLPWELEVPRTHSQQDPKAPYRQK